MVYTERQHEVVYTDQQREILKARVADYYDYHHRGPRNLSWGGLCDDISDLLHVRVRVEPLRQWVTGFVQKDKKKPLSPNAKELEAIASFLMHPDINMLLPEELEDPEPPYRLLQSFREFLRINPSSDISGEILVRDAFSLYSLGALNAVYEGVYESWSEIEKINEDEERQIKEILTLEVDHKSRGLRATERSEIYCREADEVSVFPGGAESEGWGIETPEGNLFLFMKNKSTGRHWHYYLTIATEPKINPIKPVVITHLVLLRHGSPANYDPTSKTLEHLIGERGTLLVNFKKVAQLNTYHGK